MHPAESAIRARRKLTNKLIAAHQAERLRPFLARDVKVIAGDGSLIVGAEAVVAAFAEQFREPGFATYERLIESVELDQPCERAAERGRWTAFVRGAGPAVTLPGLSGPYLAVWRKATGQWVLESEVFVTTAGA